MELDVPLPPTWASTRGGVSDRSAVRKQEQEDGSQCLVLNRPVRRGEAVLAEVPLFLSPADDEELQALLVGMCDLAAVQGARASQDPGGPPWLSVEDQLCLVVIQALFQNPDAPEFEELRQPRCDVSRWSAQADRLWTLLREDDQSKIPKEALPDLCGVVAANIHFVEGGRAGIFLMGSYANHSCIPSTFKEVAIPEDIASRPGTPDSECCPSVASASASFSRALTPPSSPGKSRQEMPQLVLRAHHDLAEGDIINYSWIPEYLPTWKRQELLQARYGISCSCDRCVRNPEVVNAYHCPKCGKGPCSPTLPISAPGGDLKGHHLSCESCGALSVEDTALAECMEAERSAAGLEKQAQVLHQYHYSIVAANHDSLASLPPAERIHAVEILMEAHRRLFPGSGHPLMGWLCEQAAAAHAALGDHHQAVAGYRRAQELYALSHRGPPETGHDQRCYLQQMRLSAGPLGVVARRLSKPPGQLSRTPSLPTLEETEADKCADEGQVS